MKFEITILGCGSALPVVHRNPTAQLISVENNNYLIDCGEGTQLALRENSAKLQNLSVIFISHLHGDHYLGLMGLLSSMSLLGRQKEVTVVGPPELEEVIRLQMKVSKSYLNYELIFKPTSADDLNLVHEDKKVFVYSFPLKHRVPCTGYKIVEKQRMANIIKSKIDFFKIPVKEIKNIKKGADFITPAGKIIANNRLVKPAPMPRSYAFCSDTIFEPKIVEYIKGVDLLYHEATFLEELRNRAEVTFHSTAKDAATIAKEAQVKRLLLGHYSARYTEIEAFRTEAETIFSPVELAEDNKVFHIESTRQG